MAGRFHGRVVVVTGGARGMGASHCRAFASEGASVVVCDREVAEGEALAAELGGDATFVEHDVTDEAAWDALVGELRERHGRWDVLVSNAGVARVRRLAQLTLEEYRLVTEVNQTGVFLGLRAAAREMPASGGGSIVNIASIAGRIGIPSSLAYNASKFAVLGMTRSAAIELARDSIRVNAVLPGYTLTTMLDDDGFSAFRDAVPARRAATPEEISAVVRFLASDEASYCTGAEFTVDGGAVAGHPYPALLPSAAGRVTDGVRPHL